MKRDEGLTDYQDSGFQLITVLFQPGHGFVFNILSVPAMIAHMYDINIKRCK